MFERQHSNRVRQPAPAGPDLALPVGSPQLSPDPAVQPWPAAPGTAWPQAHPPVPVAATRRSLRSWQRWHRHLLVTLDLIALLGAACLGLVAGGRTGDVVVGLGLVAAWLLALAGAGCYDLRQVGGGTAEMRRVVGTSVRVGLVVTLAAYLIRAEPERVLILATLAAGTLVLPAGRLAARGVLVTARRQGRYRSRVLAVGTAREVAHLVEQARRSPGAGLDIVGACVLQGPQGHRQASRPPPAEDQRVSDRRIDPGWRSDLATLSSLGVPVVSTPLKVLAAADSCRADTVIVTGYTVLRQQALHRLARQLEGEGVRLYVATVLGEATTERFALRAVGDLPALDVQAAALGSDRWVRKAVLDRVLAAVVLVPTAPLLLVLAALVGLTSRGPLLHRQQRVGVGGRTFVCLRLRTTRVEVDREVTGAPDRSDAGRVPAADPRVTAVGRVLRRWSLDGLPQLFNVLGGSMSLVGPRSPLPHEVAEYGDDVYRRLLVKPGITGLWRVSGRKDLSWADLVRLDLYYLENWSPLLDLSIMVRSVPAVFGGRGSC